MRVCEVQSVANSGLADIVWPNQHTEASGERAGEFPVRRGSKALDCHSAQIHVVYPASGALVVADMGIFSHSPTSGRGGRGGSRRLLLFTDLEGLQDGSCSLPDVLARSLDPCDGFLATTGPGSDVAEGVAPESLARHVHVAEASAG
jgi:hypothetical protein